MKIFVPIEEGLMKFTVYPLSDNCFILEEFYDYDVVYYLIIINLSPTISFFGYSPIDVFDSPFLYADISYEDHLVKIIESYKEKLKIDKQSTI